jgi:hypothetical protein
VADVRLVLYMRAGCHLCERLEELIATQLRRPSRIGQPRELVRRDVDTDENWRNLYGDRIPVLTHEGEVILEGRPEPRDVERALERLA